MGPPDLDRQAVAPVLVAAAWSAGLERVLDPLPSTARSHAVRHGRRVAHRPGVEGSGAAAYFRDHRDRPLIGPDACPHRARTRSTASVALVGGMADEHVRARSFYLCTPVPLAMALHEHPDTGSATGLLRGVEIQRLAHGRLPVAVPRVVLAETVGLLPLVPLGERRRGPAPTPVRADVVVEEWLPGTPVAVDDQGVTAELLDVVGTLWSLEETGSLTLDDDVRERVATRFAALVDRGQRWGLWPDDLDRLGLGARVRALLDAEPRLTVGLSHGDPGLGNALRTENGGLALVDWEDAGRRVLSHDVLKILNSASTPGQDWAGLHPPVPAGADPRTLPADQQLALALLQFLAGWNDRTRRARARQSMGAHRARMHRLLTALDSLLG